MNKSHLLPVLSLLISLLFTNSSYAEGFIKKEVYSFKDKNGNIVFTDKQPAKEKVYKTQTIEAANSTADSQYTYQPEYSNTQSDITYQRENKEQVVRVIVEDGSAYDKKTYKRKRSLKRCSSFKKKFDYYSDKMNSGYKSKEYKKLEKNRKKYRDLLFKNCETRTFAD